MIAIVITALVSLPIGYAIGQGLNSDEVKTSEKNHHDEKESDMTTHMHVEVYEVPDNESQPKLTFLEVIPDKKSGWNLKVETEDFKFAPENASSDHVPGEGHAHIYVDGEKLTRLYSENYYLGEFDEGQHEIRVTLNTNDHKDYQVDGKLVELTHIIKDDHHADGDGHGHTHTH